MNMNKGERNRIKQKKYKRRLKIFNPREGAKTLGYKTTSTPCSCFLCKGNRFDKSQRLNLKFLTTQELLDNRSDAYDYII